MTALRAVELFAGGGGLALGAEAAGFRHDALFELDRVACETLRRKDEWRDAVKEGDFRRANPGAHAGVDLIAGGPPCQPFSNLGRRRGAQDRRDMFPYAIGAVDEARPRAFLFENVPGILTWRYPDDAGSDLAGRLYFEHAVRRPLVEDLGYHVHVSDPPLTAADYGVPQRRERVFTVGFRRGVDARWEWPKATHSEDALIFAQWVDGSYWTEHGLPRPHTPTELVERAGRMTRRPPLKRWQTVRDAIKDLPQRPPADELRSDLGIVKEQRLDLPASTITATHWNNKLLRTDDGGLRYLTVREMARLQGFDDSWGFAGAEDDVMRQVGNAVPPPMAAALMAAIRDALAGAGAS